MASRRTKSALWTVHGQFPEGPYPRECSSFTDIGLHLQHLSDSDGDSAGCWGCLKKLCGCCHGHGSGSKLRNREREKQIEEERQRELRRREKEERQKYLQRNRLQREARQQETEREREAQMGKELHRLKREVLEGWIRSRAGQQSWRLTTEEVEELQRLRKMEKTFQLAISTDEESDSISEDERGEQERLRERERERQMRSLKQVEQESVRNQEARKIMSETEKGRMERIRREALMDMETYRELKTDLPRIWKSGETGEDRTDQVRYPEMDRKKEELQLSQLEYMHTDRLKATEKHQERMREIKILTDISRQKEKTREMQRLVDNERHELRMRELEKLSGIEWERERDVEHIRQLEKVEAARQEELGEIKKRIEQERKFVESKEMEVKKHEKRLRQLACKYQHQWEKTMLEVDRRLQKQEQISKRRDEAFFKLTEQCCKSEVIGLGKTLTEIEKNKDVEDLPETQKVRYVDPQGELKQLAKENYSEEQLYEKQGGQEMIKIEHERGMITRQDRVLQMKEEIKKMEREYEMDREMELKRHEETWTDIEEKHKEWENNSRESERKGEDGKRQPAQKKEQVLSKDRENAKAAKEAELQNMERQKKIEVEGKRTTGVDTLINKGKEWMREIKQKVETKTDSEPKLQDGEGVLDKKEGEPLSKVEKPAKGMECLREFRSNDEKNIDPGEQILLKEREERKMSECGDMEMKQKMEMKQHELVNGWPGEMDKNGSKERCSEIRKKCLEAEEMLKEKRQIMEAKTDTDQQEKRMRKTTKKQQKVEKKTDSEPELQDGEGVLDEKEGEPMSKVEKPVEGMEWLREFKSNDEKRIDPGEEILVKEREERKMITEEEMEKKQHELVDGWPGEMDKKGSQERWSKIRKKRLEAEEMLRGKKQIMGAKTDTDEEKRMTVRKTLETMKDTLKNEGMEWLEEIRQNVEEKTERATETDRELHQEQQIIIGETVGKAKTVQGRRERVSERKMEGGQVDKKCDDYFGGMDGKSERDREINKKISEDRWSGFGRTHQRRRMEPTQESLKNEEDMKRNTLAKQRDMDQKTNKESPVDMCSYSQTERREKEKIAMEIEKPIFKGMGWLNDIKQNMDMVKDSVKDIDEAFGILDDKANTEKRTVRNRRQREEERKCDIKQVKKEELLDDWLEEREQKTTEERMQELREKRLKRLQEKTQEMEEKKREKEREMAEKQLVRQREVEQKAKMIRLLLADPQGETEKKEMAEEKKVEVKETSPDDKQVSESDWHSEIDIEKVPQRQRLTQNCTTNEVIKTAWDVKMEKKKVLQSDIERELKHTPVKWQNSSRVFGIEKEKKNQKELNAIVIQQENIKESRPNDKLRVSGSDWHTELEIDNMRRRQRPTQNCATNETASNVKMDKKKELQTDMKRELKHTVVEWQNSSRLLELEKEKGNEKRWAKDWKEEMAKQNELNEMVIQQENVEVKDSRPNDKLRVPEMGNVPRRQRPTQNCSTNEVIKTTWDVKVDKKKELQTDIERELNHTLEWQNSSRLLETEKKKKSQKRWDREWEEEMAEQKESNEKEQLKRQREEQERQEQKEKEKQLEIEKQKELKQQREMARQKEIDRQKEQETEMRKEIEKTVEMEKQRELEREKELQRKRDRKQKEEMEKQRVLEEFNQGQRKKDNRVKMAWNTQIHNNEKPTEITEQQLVHQTLIQSQEVASSDCELLDIELDGEGSGIIPFAGRLIPKSEMEEVQRQQKMESLHQCAEFYNKGDSDESVSEKVRGLEIEKLKKGNVAFMPLKTEEETQRTTEQELPQDVSEVPDPEMRHEEDETQGATEQELPQDFSGGPDPEMRHGEEKMDEGQSKGQLENTSPHLNDTNSSNKTELVGEGSTVVKDKSVRRRLFHWANEKAKKHFTGKIERTIVREQEEGDQLYHPWYMPYATYRADREKQKRSSYLNYEDARQEMEAKWQKWQVNKAERKKQKKAEQEIFNREFKESLAAYYNHPGMYYGFPGAFVNRPN